MFTGIIEDVGTIKSLSNSQISIETALPDIKIGDSVAVNGVCLTASKLSAGGFLADYSPQTDKMTNLSTLKKGSKVNLERALTPSGRMGGHIVSGHIDGSAKISKIEKRNRFFRVVFACQKELCERFVDKGSVAIDGISLTISSLMAGGFEVFIIPQTFANTNLSRKKEGDMVNIETDILMKYIEKLENKKTNSEGKLLSILEENGYL
ncbi:MAG: riboflavin synthase [Elusimicrobiota bacterium]|jgi:riboflavin synthase|nr:riboflavin synthase [Elusimicrobiota bacterium]